MEQTLQINDRVLVNKLVYRFRDIHRGEIVVFNGLDSFSSEVPPQPPANGVQQGPAVGQRARSASARPGEKDFIKRVIGVPGDRVACCTDGKVTVQPQGSDTPVPLDEPYLYEDNQMPFCDAGVTLQACPPGAAGVLVPAGRLWVLGDHRSAVERLPLPHRRRQQGHRAGRQGDRPGVRHRLAGRPRLGAAVPATFDDQALGYAVAGRAVRRRPRARPARHRAAPAGPPPVRRLTVRVSRQAVPARPGRPPAAAGLHRPRAPRHPLAGAARRRRRARRGRRHRDGPRGPRGDRARRRPRPGRAPAVDPERVVPLARAGPRRAPRGPAGPAARAAGRRRHRADRARGRHRPRAALVDRRRSSRRTTAASSRAPSPRCCRGCSRASGSTSRSTPGTARPGRRGRTVPAT